MNDDRNNVVSTAYPRVISTDSARTRRYWILRTQNPAPSVQILENLSNEMADIVRKAIFDSYTEANTEVLQQSLPDYALILLAEFHLALRIDFVSAQPLYGDSELLSQWGALRWLHERLHLEEVQGLPVGFWFQLGSKEVAPCKRSS